MSDDTCSRLLLQTEHVCGMVERQRQAEVRFGLRHVSAHIDDLKTAGAR